jgi:hypothetical protein
LLRYQCGQFHQYLVRGERERTIWNSHTLPTDDRKCIDVLTVGTQIPAAVSSGKTIRADYVGAFSLAQQLASLENKFLLVPESRGLGMTNVSLFPQIKVSVYFFARAR